MGKKDGNAQLAGRILYGACQRLNDFWSPLCCWGLHFDLGHTLSFLELALLQLWRGRSGLDSVPRIKAHLSVTGMEIRAILWQVEWAMGKVHWYMGVWSGHQGWRPTGPSCSQLRSPPSPQSRLEATWNELSSHLGSLAPHLPGWSSR